MSLLEPRECEWQVNGLRLQGLSWGRETDPPILALHGWLDNAQSFACLAPKLAGYQVVALDLTGHGRSDWRSADASYHIWDDLPEVLGVVEQLGWATFALMGHSRGAIIATLLAASNPDRVGQLLLFDAIAPPAVVSTQFPQQLAISHTDKVRLAARPKRVYPDLEAAIAVRLAKGLSRESAERLAQRGVIEYGGGLSWTSDPRLQGASAVKLTEAQNQAVLEALTMPVLLLLATEGYMGKVAREPIRASIPQVEIESVEGGHHFHMDGDVDALSHRVLTFLGAK